MDINKLLSPTDTFNDHHFCHKEQESHPQPQPQPQPQIKQRSVHDDQLMPLWEEALKKTGYNMKTSNERNTLTDAILTPMTTMDKPIPVHIKVIGRHINGSFRCHIGTSKASRPIRSTELCHQMRLLAVFFRTENARSQHISSEFIFFPTWLLHLFRYTQYGSTPGRTDIRFLENANMAKEDHIYRLNHVINTLFRFNLYDFDPAKLRSAIELARFLFDAAGLDYRNLPRPLFSNESSISTDGHEQQQQQLQPALYSTLLLLLHSPRPTKFKPMCFNCNTKPASRRRLCVACYRYQLKNGEPRPLRLIVANRPGPRIQQEIGDRVTTTTTNRSSSSLGKGAVTGSNSSNNSTLPMVFYPLKESSLRNRKYCANCKVQETHQWYRNLCGHGHWCETCKSYYLRHSKVRPPELFIKAAKRKVDVRNLVNWSSWSWDDIPVETVEAAAAAISLMTNGTKNTLNTNITTNTDQSNNEMIDYYFGGNNNNNSADLTTSPANSSIESSPPSSFSSSPTTPPLPITPYYHHHHHRQQQQLQQHQWQTQEQVPKRASSFVFSTQPQSSSTNYW